MCSLAMENKNNQSAGYQSVEFNQSAGLNRSVELNQPAGLDRSVESNHLQRLASLDIGTVTTRLLLADVYGNECKELKRCVAITNLGVGVDKTHMLQEDAIERVVQQIAEYVSVVNSSKTEEFPEIPIRAVATSAARDAQNSSVLVERLQALGVELAIIEGTREAALSFRGAAVGHEGEHLLVADIGGGSTELVFGIGGQDPKMSHSFNIGCRRMTERFLAGDPPSTQECDQLRAFVRDHMRAYFDKAQAQGCMVDRIIAVAGTPTSVVAIDKHMEVYDSSKVHNTVVPRETLERIFENLRQMPLEQRKGVVGLEPARASVIVAGLAILLEVLTLANCSSFTVSESDILQGVLLTEQDFLPQGS